MDLGETWNQLENLLKRSDTVHQSDDNSVRKTIAVVGYQAPEALLIASGVHYFYLEPDELPTSPADSALQVFTCAQVRSILSQALRGAYDSVDALLFCHSCDSIRSLAGVWTSLFPTQKVEYFRFPHFLQASGAIPFLESELRRLQQWLVEITGIECENQKIIDAWNLLLTVKQKATELHRIMLNMPQTNYEKLNLLYRVLMRSPKPQLAEKIDSLVNMFQTQQGAAEVNGSPSKQATEPSVVITGSRVPLWLVTEFQQLGISILFDDLFWGSRWFQDLPSSKSEEISTSSDPLTHIASHMLQACLEPHHHSQDHAGKKAQRIIDIVEQTHAQGVVYLNYKFCESYAFEFPAFRKMLENESIPCIYLELDTDPATGRAQISNRLEAFSEMISQRR